MRLHGKIVGSSHIVLGNKLEVGVYTIYKTIESTHLELPLWLLISKTQRLTDWHVNWFSERGKT